MEGVLKQESVLSPSLEANEPLETPDPPGFRILLSFHTVFGVCYFGLISNPIVKFVSLTVTLTFAVSVVVFSLPCVVNCAYNWTQLFRWGLSPQFLAYTIIGLDVYHSVMSCIIIGFRSRRLRDFFERSSDYCNTFAVNLLPAQRTKLTSVAVKLLFLNLLHLAIEVCLLTLLVPHKVVAGGNGGGKEKTESEDEKPETSSFLYPVVLTIRVLQVIYSKVIESNLIFLMEYLALIVQRLEMKYDKFVYRNLRSSSGRSIEVAKVAFIEVQNLIREADEVFSHTAFDPLFVDVLILLLGMMEFCDGVTRRRRVSREDFHELFNAFASLISIYLCCESIPHAFAFDRLNDSLSRVLGSSGDCIESEMAEVVQSISYINAERFSEQDYKSVSCHCV